MPSNEVTIKNATTAQLLSIATGGDFYIDHHKNCVLSTTEVAENNEFFISDIVLKIRCLNCLDANSQSLLKSQKNEELTLPENLINRDVLIKYINEMVKDYFVSLVKGEKPEAYAEFIVRRCSDVLPFLAVFLKELEIKTISLGEYFEGTDGMMQQRPDQPPGIDPVPQ